MIRVKFDPTKVSELVGLVCDEYICEHDYLEKIVLSNGFLCILDEHSRIILNKDSSIIHMTRFYSKPKYIGFDTMDNAVLYRLSCE